MKLFDDIYLIASGGCGFSLTHQLDCNVYLIDCQDGCIMVDAGSNVEPERIVEQMKIHGFSLEDVRLLIITHAHADHASGAAYFRSITGAQTLMSEHEASLLTNQTRLDSLMDEVTQRTFYHIGYRHMSCPADRLVEDGDFIVLGDKRFEVLITPGHTGGGICLYGTISGKQVLFTGDTVAYGGLINFICVEDADINAYHRSIDRLATLPVDVMFPGHLGPVLNLAHLQICKAKAYFDRMAVPPNIF